MREIVFVLILENKKNIEITIDILRRTTHLLKYINQATVEFPEYRSKLWYNINIYDPISVENIFKEIIRKTEDEKRKEKEYKKHHKEIQDKKTQKKMKKDKKKSEAYNQHKPPLKSRRAAKKRARKR